MSEATNPRAIDFELAERPAPFAWMPEAGFMNQNRDTLHELFTALDREEYFQLDRAGNPTQAMLDYMWVRWLGDTHGYTGDHRDAGKEKFTTEDKERVWPIASRLMYGDYSLTDTVAAPADTDFDQMWVVGGTDKANYRRWLEGYKAEDVGSTIREVVLWGGQRPRMKTEGTLAEIALGRLLDPKPSDEAILGSISSQWARQQLDTADNGEWDQPFATEDELTRLSLSRIHPGAEAGYRRARIDMQPNPEPGTPPRFIATREFQTDGKRIVLLNGKAVQREAGAPRHTTASCALESLDLAPPTSEDGAIKHNANILIATGNPHLRTSLHALLAIRGTGQWDNLNFDIACSSMAPAIPLITLLGEIPPTMKYDALLRK